MLTFRMAVLKSHGLNTQKCDCQEREFGHEVVKSMTYARDELYADSVVI
jgi:hypothetical protein